MLAIGRERKRRGALPGDTVVGTVMSNAGLERALRDEAIALVRAPVGDRYVLAEMRERGLLFGGEQSGHVIDLDRNTTGDGPMTAVTLLSIAAREKTTLRELTAALVIYPQILVNVRTRDRSVHETNDSVRASIAQGERALGGDGRILVRASGTEPLVRVMVEGPDDALIAQVAQRIADSIKSVSGIEGTSS
jgi:phosphoglucosamine mutase